MSSLLTSSSTLSSFINGDGGRTERRKGQKMRFINFPLETCARFTVYSFPLPRIRWKHVLFLFIAFMIFVLMFNKETVENEIVTYFDGDILDNETKILNIVLEMDNTRSTVADEFSTYTPIYNTGSLHLEYCPEKPSGLLGGLHIPSHADAHRGNISSIMQEIENQNKDLINGGIWFPKTCQSNQSLALIIPFRNRSEHLAILLTQLHQMLKRQLLRYQIFVVEQFGDNEFNKARLMNIAFDFVNRSNDSYYDCFIFHDVDLIPENDRNYYRCDEENPRHLSPAVSTLRYKLPYKELIGGVLAVTPAIFEQVNGYSNLYWGWGGEDDDMYYRIEAENLTVVRSPILFGRYKMIKHKQRPPKDGKIRFKLVWSAKTRYKQDGIAQLSTLNYTIVNVEKRLLYTHIMVDLGLPPKK